MEVEHGVVVARSWLREARRVRGVIARWRGRRGKVAGDAPDGMAWWCWGWQGHDEARHWWVGMASRLRSVASCHYVEVVRWGGRDILAWQSRGYASMSYSPAMANRVVVVVVAGGHGG